MAVSLETRLPLVDQNVVAAVNRLPADARFQPLGRKQALRTIVLQGIDPALFDRPKSGFVMPFDPWIRRRLGAEMDATMRDPALARDAGLNGQAVERLWRAYQAGAAGIYWSRVWAVYILLRWTRRHRLTP
jgi:asparagine synthase (glutamine-hydrolysing)